MPGMPEGPLQFEDDLAQIRDDISRIQNDLNWMREYGIVILQFTHELKNIRRLMQLQQGYTTEEEVLKEHDKDDEVIRQLQEEHEKRRMD